ncbi:hypothetical protein [Roseicyclus sp.]|uniref:hypothetical protein n=1 Tax=Roseicyclus sp. TaxID=1914329 RepID=UPI001BCC8960|nr:hypothetical protein [Roseicyclus sp.]
MRIIENIVMLAARDDRPGALSLAKAFMCTGPWSEMQPASLLRRSGHDVDTRVNDLIDPAHASKRMC